MNINVRICFRGLFIFKNMWKIYYRVYERFLIDFNSSYYIRK